MFGKSFGRGLREFLDEATVIDMELWVRLAPVESYLSVRLIDMIGAIESATCGILPISPTSIVLAST